MVKNITVKKTNKSVFNIVPGQFDDVDDDRVVVDVDVKSKIDTEFPEEIFDPEKKHSNPATEPFPHEIDNYDDEDYTFAELEMALLGEDNNMLAGGSGKFNVNCADLGKRMNLSNRTQNDIVRSEKKSEKRHNYYGRDDRATSEQVLDPRTRLILFKLLSSGYLTEIDGCLSTGKEANVYYARGKNDEEYAVKIFKTSILVFKDRDKYVSGEYRFRNGYCRSNPRKMVRTWAEKELRNLKRLQTAGLYSPTPALLKSHVLVMEFLGTDGWCSPRLKDVTLSPDEVLQCYKEIVVSMYQMYHVCNLVHGDLSEYNILWHRNHPYIIDVSQSVEQAHPFANDFLRKDIANVTDFFRKQGLATVLPPFKAFEFITVLYPAAKCGDTVDTSILLSHLVEVLDEIEFDEDFVDDSEKDAQKEVEEAVFMQSYIPTSLAEFSNPVAEKVRLESGQREPVYEAAVRRMLGKAGASSGSRPEAGDAADDLLASDGCLAESAEDDGEDLGNVVEGEDDCDEESDVEDESGGSDDEYSIDEEEDGREPRTKSDKYSRRLPPVEDSESRQLAKAKKREACKSAKEAAALKRQSKVPKHIKKRAVKGGKKK